MKFYTAAANPGLFPSGNYNELYIIGANRGANGASDFTAAATTQTITLSALAIGDIIDAPWAMGWVGERFTDGARGATPTTLANLKCDVGHTDDTDALIIGVNADLIQDKGYPLAPLGIAAAGGGGYRTTAASKNLVAVFTSTAGNMSTITFGEVWIYVSVKRVNNCFRGVVA